MDILERSLEQLRMSWATNAIPEKVSAPQYDRAFAVRICDLVFEKCGASLEDYGRAVDDFIALSEEFVRLQIELDRTGRYRHSSFADVRASVYDNPEVMNGRYLNGLLLSQAFWVNHAALFAFFEERFAAHNAPHGNVLEVPCGTGFYIAEFARANPGWSAEGIDLSESSVAFAREVVRLDGAAHVDIRKGDVFELPEDARYERIICGELLEHLEDPEALLAKLARLLARDGRLFLTTAIWAASIDHIYLFESASDVCEMLARYFSIEAELVVNVREGQRPDHARVPLNFAAILAPAR